MRSQRIALSIALACFGLAAGLAFVTALVSIAVLMRVLRHMSFMPFVIYRLFLGVVLLVLYYGFDWTLAI